MRLFVLLGLLAALAHVAGAQTTAATSPAAAHDWSGVIRQLGSPDFSRREAAQKELEQATWHDYDALQRLAAGNTDPEVIARLGPRLDLLGAQAALNPPPLSLHVTNATLAQVAQALEATPEFRILALQQDIPSRTMTANIADRSLWQILDQVNAQIPLRLGNRDRQLALVAATSPLRQLTMTEYSGVAAFPSMVEIFKGAGIQRPPEQVQYLNFFQLSYAVCVDRRIPLATMPTMEIRSAVDNHGNELIDQKRLGPRSAPHENPLPFIYYNAADLLPLADMGDTLVNVKGQVTLIVESGYVERDFAKELPVNTPIPLGSATLILTQFSVTDSPVPALGATVQVVMSWQPPPPPPGTRLGAEGGSGTRLPPPNPTLAIFDAQGHLLGKQVAPIGQGSEIRLMVPKVADSAPLKFRLSMPTRSHAFTIPFTFHDLPLPK